MSQKKCFLLYIVLFFAMYVLSFLGYYAPLLRELTFLFIILITSIIAWHKTWWGVLIILAELLVGSQGHLFDVQLTYMTLSIRMGLFLTLLTVIFIKTLVSLKNNTHLWLQRLNASIPQYWYVFLLFVSIVWGIIWGIYQKNNPLSLYQDANGYFYFLLLPVFAKAFYPFTQIKKRGLLTLTTSAVVFQGIVSLILLFSYGHLAIFWRLLMPLYTWFRDIRLIEVGIFNDNMYRIFMQSHIWTLIIFFILLAVTLHARHEERIEKSKKKMPLSRKITLAAFWTSAFMLSIAIMVQIVQSTSIYNNALFLKPYFLFFSTIFLFQQKYVWIALLVFIFFALVLFFPRTLSLYKKNTPHQPLEKKDCYEREILFTLIVILISLSRSLWLGLILGLIFFSLHYVISVHISPHSDGLYKKKTTTSVMMIDVRLIFIVLIAVSIIAEVLIVPITDITGLQPLTSFSERVTKIDEPAISSRWNLLAPLWKSIQGNVALGNGFGAEVTYKSEDPRYVSAHPDNPYYTTSAFEWGWLDVWHEMGIIGFIAFLLYIGIVLKKGIILCYLHPKESINFGLSTGCFVLVIVHFFTPFLNHPLGISFLLMADSIFNAQKK